MIILSKFKKNLLDSFFYKYLIRSLIITLFIILGVFTYLKFFNSRELALDKIYTPLDLTAEESLWLTQNQTLYVSIKPAWAPISFVSEQGDYRGISIDYLNRLEKILNIKFNRLNAREDILQENADLILAASPGLVERGDRYQLINKPIIISDFIIYTKKTNPISDLDGLRGKKVAVFKTGIVAKELAIKHPDIHLYAADIAEEAIDVLTKGQVDAYIGNSVVVDYVIKSQGFFNISGTGVTPYKSQIYMAVKQSSPHLNSIISKALEKIDNDERQAIINSWTHESSNLHNKYLKIAILILIVLGLFLVFFIYANFRLNLEVENRKIIERSLREQKSKAEELLSQIDKLNNNLEARIKKRTIQLEKEIEERKDAESNLRKTQSILIESEKMASLGNLVAGVAHEVNTPLGVAITAMSYLKDLSHHLNDGYQKEKMKRSDLEAFLKNANDSIDITLNNLSRASQLIKSFKEISVDRTDEDVRKINLLNYINQILMSLQPNLKKFLLNINLSKISEAIFIEIEPGALAQVLTNLIMNSLVHGFENRKDGQIIIAANINQSDLQIIYQDNGKGIAKENLSKIFEPFFSTKRREGGSGLGLNIVYNIINHKFGGTIQVKSSPNKGAKFLINIPNCVREG